MDFFKLKNLMDMLTGWRIPGNSIKVYKDNKEVFSYQSGYSDLENKIKMKGDELFNIYSCSKVMTVTAAMILYERGMYLLDDPVYDFIPEYKNITVKDENGDVKKAENTMTLRHLFTMTSGLSYVMDDGLFDDIRKNNDGKMATLDVVKRFPERPLMFEPGKMFAYSLSHDVLAGVVEVVSGMKFRDFVKKNILEPLDMNETYYHNEKVLDRVAEQYLFKDSDETDIVNLQASGNIRSGGAIEHISKEVSFAFGPEYDSGGAGITTSISDYGKFTTALANGGIGMNGNSIISGRTIDLMRHGQLNDEQKKTFNWSQLTGYNYGLGFRTLESIPQSGTIGNVGEFGWGGAAGATVLVDPKEKLSVFYAHHMLNPQENFYQPRLRNVLYACL